MVIRTEVTAVALQPCLLRLPLRRKRCGVPTSKCFSSLPTRLGGNVFAIICSQFGCAHLFCCALAALGSTGMNLGAPN